MGFLKRIFGGRAAVRPLPAGSITVSRNGDVVTSTVSSTYPRAALLEIARDVLRLFSEARKAQLSLAELNLQFASFRITAREIQGGAVIFLSPENAQPSQTKK